MEEKALWEEKFYLLLSAGRSWRVKEKSLEKQNVGLVEFIIDHNQS
jgi:hypothetical protein